jgi:hypothetical protein
MSDALWAAMQLSDHPDVCDALTRGLPVPRSRLRSVALARIGEPSEGDDFVLTDNLVLRCETRLAGPSRTTQSHGQPSRRLMAVPASEIKMEATEWLWENRIPRGEVTLFAGLPGIGKSMHTAWLAACNSRGSLGREAGVTLMATAEDSPERTVLPRLKAWDADLSRIRFLQILEGQHGEEVPEGVLLPTDTAAIREAAEALGANLLTVDPLMAHLDVSVDSYRDQAVRHALKPLYFLAKDLGCAVVALLHLNKNVGNDPLQRIGGSTGIPAAARSALLLARDPDDPDGDLGRRRILAHTKCNVGPEARSLLYEIEPILIPAADDEPSVETARIEERGESDLTGRDLLAGPTANSSKLEDAMDFLENQLAEGPRPSRELKQAAEDAGIAAKTLRRARERLRVRDERAATGHTTWQLPLPAHELHAHSTGAQGAKTGDGHEGESPFRKPFAPLRAQAGTEPFVPTLEKGHEAGHETRQSTPTNGTPVVTDEQVREVLARYPDYDRSDWPAGELETFVSSVLLAEARRGSATTGAHTKEETDASPR